jgi:hypothetical protein
MPGKYFSMSEGSSAGKSFSEEGVTEGFVNTFPFRRERRTYEADLSVV